VKVSREYVEDILAVTSLSAEEKKRIRDLTYPADRDELLALFASMGVTPDRLTSRMGGSP
jgi:DNA-directed RNA polymerase subunit F